MSETCGGCVYDGVPLDGVDVTVEDGGRLGIGGPTVFAGYRLDPAATADALVGGRLLTRDRGEVGSDGRVTVLGRIDDVVISGGLNVDLAAVERAVRAWARRARRPWSAYRTRSGAPRWSPSSPRSRIKRSSRRRAGCTLGRLGGRPILLSDLRAALADRLPTYALPRRLVVRTALPRTSGGKIDRRQLIADLTGRPVDRPEDPT